MGSTDTPGRHTVLAEADSSAYHSLRQRPVTRAERYALGKSLRQKVPRQSLADWTPPSDRPDPIGLIEENHEGRLERLIPIRVGRMVASPYGFLRGTAVVMADDVARLPVDGIMPVVCGDAHLGNFGFYASPERDLVIDLNDFDEAHPGGWEWDLRRLVASIWVAGRQNGASEESLAAAVRSCVGAYRQELRRLADEPLFSRSFTRLDVDRLAGQMAGPLQDEVIAVGEPGAEPHQRPCAAPVHPGGGRRPRDRRGAAADHPAARARSAGAGRGARRLPATPVHPLAARAGRLHPARRRAQGGGRGQRRAARVCGAAGRVFAGGRRLPPAEAGPPVGAGALRARRVGVARASGPAGRRVPAGAADRERPAARAGPRWTAGSTTCGSSAT